jgi:hypothetical protein
MKGDSPYISVYVPNSAVLGGDGQQQQQQQSSSSSSPSSSSVRFTTISIRRVS